ncbi:hypothetical protein HWV01_16100 [Moritella sp. 5]|uniref:small VCP/p97-interacting protein n=1 Tax=Moritella sp. 5 TaxID=2746231 RepID=UPI001BAA10D4|nr:small VCP/p97-interacting protein [Moritella sp. 5]QUM81696.1 hypothetical protein HWV01_16100 [Moritella sp. 5]
MDWAEDVMRILNCCLFLFAIFLAFKSGYFSAYFFSLDRSKSEFANLSVFIGSISTAVTFVFLIIQNIKIREQQKLADRKQEEAELRQEAAEKRQEAADQRQEQFELRQKEIWDSQQVKIQFEMYQAHKREFFRVLDDIENPSSMDIEFYNREELYRRIYPMNSFKSVSLDIDNTDSSMPGDLADINKSYLLIIKQLTAFSIGNMDEKERKEAPHLYLLALVELLSLLNLTIIPKDKFGDVLVNKKMVLNAYNLDTSINTLYHVLKGIMAFIGYQNIAKIPNLSGPYYYDAMQCVLFKHIKTRTQYNVNLDNKKYAIALFDLYMFFNNETIRHIDSCTGLGLIHSFMRDGKKIANLIKNEEQLARLVNTLFNQYNDFFAQLPQDLVQQFEGIYSQYPQLFQLAERYKITELYCKN